MTEILVPRCPVVDADGNRCRKIFMHEDAQWDDGEHDFAGQESK